MMDKRQVKTYVKQEKTISPFGDKNIAKWTK